MDKDLSLDTINFSKYVVEPYPFSGKIREEIVDTVIRSGVLDTNANIIEGSKEKIADYYASKKGSQSEFGEFLCELYSHNIYTPVSLREPDVPYAPFDMCYNQAGLHYKFRDKNRVIHIECIGWSEVARRIGRMIRHNEYFSEKPLSILREKRNRDAR